MIVTELLEALDVFVTVLVLATVCVAVAVTVGLIVLMVLGWAAWRGLRHLVQERHPS